MIIVYIKKDYVHLKKKNTCNCRNTSTSGNINSEGVLLDHFQ